MSPENGSDAGVSEEPPPDRFLKHRACQDLEASHEATSAISVGSELVRRAPRVFDAIRPVSEKGCHVAPDTATVALVP